MKIFILFTLILAGCASRPGPRPDIEIKVLSSHEFEMRIPGVSISEVKLDHGMLDPSDSKANYTVVFYKENGYFKGVTKKKLNSARRSRLSFMMHSKGKTELVNSYF